MSIKMTLEFLVWHCIHCDYLEIAQTPDYKEDDTEPCVHCAKGTATAKKATLVLGNTDEENSTN